MVCSLYSRRRTNVLWSSFIGVTFLFRCLLVYNFLNLCNAWSPPQSDCSTKNKGEECSSTCNTRECIFISNYILNYMNQTADPCNNFYNFACGNWEAKYGTYADTSAFHQASDGLYLTLKNVIEISQPRYRTAMYKVKMVYDSCMDTGSTGMRAIETIFSFFRHIGLHNWPNLSANFSFANTQLPELLGKLNIYKQGLFYEFHMSSFNDSENYGDLHSLEVGFVPDTIDSEKYSRLLTQILGKLGLDFNTIKNTWKDYITIKEKVSELQANSLESGYTTDSGFNVIKCPIEKDESKIMVCKVLSSVKRNGKFYQFYKDKFDISNSVMYYIENIYGLIKNYSDRTIANYIALNILFDNLEYLNFPILKSVRYSTFMATRSTLFHVYPERWKYCVVWLTENMPYPLAALYQDICLPNEILDEINNMVQELKDTIADLILRQEWITETSRKEAFEMMKRTDNVFRHLSETMMNTSKINSIYKKFSPNRSNFLINVLMNKKILYAAQLNEEELLKYDALNPFQVLAGAAKNFIYLTYGILKPPFFKYYYPKLFNMAKIGFVTGHEIGHTIYEYLERVSEDDEETGKNFNEKLDCLIRQYNGFEQKRIKQYVDGDQTKQENFPDSISLKVVEKISEHYIRDMTESGFALPGISYSLEELFYISFAQTWCGTNTPASELQRALRDTHAPNEFRVIGSLQNSHQFSRVFNCSKTSYMNSQKKCSVFD